MQPKISEGKMRLGTWLLVMSGLLFSWAGTALSDDMLGYYRYPTAYGEQVVFVAEGDLWTAPLSGGVARRLTTAAGEERLPVFSPDGKWIAFSGNYDGNTDVYVIPAQGGEPKRLTYHPGVDLVTGWTPDGKVSFRSLPDSGPGIWRGYTVGMDGVYPEPVPVDAAALITFEPNGDRIAYNRDAHGNMGYGWWKRYRGGAATDIWVGSTKTHDYENVTHSDGNETSPMWYGDRIYFMRDNDARMNIHSMKPDGSDLQQHTFHTDWDARWPSLGGGKIAYSLGADIWVFDIRTNQTRQVDIQLPSDMLQTRGKFVSPDEYTNDFALGPEGKRLLVGARGEIFTAPTERRGIIRQISRTMGAREKGACFTPDGTQVLAWSDQSGEEALYLYPADGVGEPKKLADGSSGWNFAPAISPDGKWAIYGDCRRALQLVDMATGQTSPIDSSQWEMRDYEWSPDSRYLAYSVALQIDEASTVIRIFDLTEQKVHEVTDRLFSSSSPAWDPQGKWLYFISSRFMNAFGSAIDWSFIVLEPDQIFALALDLQTKSPYAYSEDGAPAEEKKDEKKKEDAEKKDDEKKVEVKITWDGLADRIIKLPVDPGNYGGLSAIESKLYFVSWPLHGWRSSDSEDDDARAASLKLFDVKKTKLSEVLSDVRGYTLSPDRKKVAVRKKDGFAVMDAGVTEVPEPDKDDKDAGLHLEDWTYDVDPRTEWRQVLNEAWRLERDFFYAPNMHGVDWAAQREHYGLLLPRIRTRDELNDLISQLIGELSAGHTYVWGGDTERSKSVGVGLLGIDVTRTEDGFYRIDRILGGERWESGRTSPLNEPGMNVQAGEYLVAVDNVPTNSVPNYLSLLDNKADRLVVLSINASPSLDGARQIVVKPMGDESALRYWDWAAGRREYVRQNGGDSIAYVHLSDMGGDGMEQWMKEYYPQSGKRALIVDVRWNGGGNIAGWILSQLERTTWTWKRARNSSHYRYPISSFYGPMVAVCNSETGSDGETFSEGFKRLDLGKLIGKRTWGGWVGYRGDKPFVDRGMLTQPEFTGWGKEGTWLIEGAGVYPDVEVENHPQQVMDDFDEQLDFAIRHLLDKMKNEPMKVPPQPAYPDKAPTGYRK
jgi:tricorn protease